MTSQHECPLCRQSIPPSREKVYLAFMHTARTTPQRVLLALLRQAPEPITRSELLALTNVSEPTMTAALRALRDNLPQGMRIKTYINKGYALEFYDATE